MLPDINSYNDENMVSGIKGLNLNFKKAAICGDRLKCWTA
jgi:hypothetical protein